MDDPDLSQYLGKKERKAMPQKRQRKLDEGSEKEENRECASQLCGKAVSSSQGAAASSGQLHEECISQGRVRGCGEAVPVKGKE